METQKDQGSNALTAIDRALAAAKARKAGAATPASEGDKPKAAAAPISATRPSQEERAAAKAARDAARAAKAGELAGQKAAAAEAKAAAKAARKAEREAAKSARKPAHMKKVDRARSKCPPLSTEAEALYGDATSNFSIAQLDALSQHLAVHVRAARTLRAAGTPPLSLGATVRITGGEAKYIGAVGTVVHSQKLRAKVAVEGVRRPVYIYTGEAEPVDPTPVG